MPWLIEHRGRIVRRFIWWKLRYETGYWAALTATGGLSLGSIWTRVDDGKVGEFPA